MTNASCWLRERHLAEGDDDTSNKKGKQKRSLSTFEVLQIGVHSVSFQWEDFETCEYFFIHHWFVVSWLPLRKQICMWLQSHCQYQPWLISLSNWCHIILYWRACLATTHKWQMKKRLQTPVNKNTDFTQDKNVATKIASPNKKNY